MATYQSGNAESHLDGILLAVLEPGPDHGYVIMEALRASGGSQVGTVE